MPLFSQPICFMQKIGWFIKQTSDLYEVSLMQNTKMSSGGSISQINSSWRNLNSLACTVYSPNITSDGLATWTDLRTADCQKQIQYSQLWEESYKTGRSKLRHKGIIKRNLGVVNIPLNNLQSLLKNLKNWWKKICHHWMDSKYFCNYFQLIEKN